MKQKQLIKRGLAAVLSAAMALSLAPNVGLLSVPAEVRAADPYGTAIITIAGPDGSSTSPKYSANGAYANDDEYPTLVNIGANDSTGAEFTITYKNGVANNVVPSIIYYNEVTPTNESLLDDVTVTLGEYDDTGKTQKMTIKTSNAVPGSTYTLKLDTKNETAEADGDVTLNITIGYVVKYVYAIGNDTFTGGDSAVKVLAKDAKVTLGKDLDNSALSLVNETHNGWYDYEDFTVDGSKVMKPNDIIKVEKDTTIKVNWKNVVSVDSISDEAAKKTYDGTDKWAATIKGKVPAENNKEVDVNMTGKYIAASSEAAEAVATGKTIDALDGEIADSVQNKDNYILKISDALKTSGKTGAVIEKATIEASDINYENLTFEKDYDGTALDKTKVNANAEVVATINGEKLPLPIDSIEYEGNVVAADQKKAGEYKITAVLEDPSSDPDNYDFAEGAEKITGLTGVIKKVSDTMSFGEKAYKFTTGEDNEKILTNANPAVDVANNAETTINVGALWANGTVAYNAGLTTYEAFEAVPENYDLFKTSTDIDSNGKLTFIFNYDNVETALNALGEGKSALTTRVNILPKDGNNESYEIKGYIDLTISTKDIAYISNINAIQKYGEAGVTTYKIGTSDGADDLQSKVKPYTTVTYTDATGKDVSDDVAKGLIPYGTTTITATVKVDGAGYYGTSPSTLSVTAGDLTAANFATDTTELVYGDDMEEPEFYYVDPKDEGHEIGKNESDPADIKDIAITAKYTLDPTANPLVTSTFAQIKANKPAEDLVIYPVITDTDTTPANGSNYTQLIGGELVLTDYPITIYAEAPTKTDINNITVSGINAEYVLEGEGVYPETYKLTDGVYELVEGTDFVVEYGENNAVGEGTITFTGIGLHYEGEVTKKFAIKAPEKSDEEKAAEALAAAEAAADAYVKAAEALPQTKDAVTDTAKADSDIAAAKALAPTEAQMALLGDETKAKVEAAAAKIANAEKAVADKKADNNKENEQPTPTPGGNTDTTTGSSADVTPSGSGSGGSGGGGGSSNAKTVKNSDGSTTTTTTTAKGTIETTTKTNADGSKTTSKVVKNKDGSGSVTETSVSAAGTTKVVEVVTDTTGAATEVTTTVSNANGASMKVTYAAKGTAITVSKVETTNKTAVSIPATVKVGGKTYKVTKIAASALKGNKDITKVTLGKNIKAIGKNAFNGDSKLKTIVMKKAPTTVGKNAFKGIAKKATIKIKASAKAFKAAKKLIKKSGIASTVKIKRTK